MRISRGLPKRREARPSLDVEWTPVIWTNTNFKFALFIHTHLYSVSALYCHMRHCFLESGQRDLCCGARKSMRATCGYFGGYIAVLFFCLS